MFCTSCGSEIEDGSKFCTVCGANLEQIDGYGSNAIPTPAPAPAPNAAPIPTQAPAPSASPFSASAPGYGSPVQAPNKKSPLPIFIAIAGVVIVVLLVVIIGLLLAGGEDNAANSTSSFTSQSSSVSSSASSKVDPGTVTLSAMTTTGQRLSGDVHRDSSDSVLADSSSRLYTMAELRAMNLTPAEICVAWNEPFARLGYHFGNSDLSNYFKTTSWYVDRGIKPTLSGVAAQNNELLRQLADERGDAALWKDLVLDNN